MELLYILITVMAACLLVSKFTELHIEMMNFPVQKIELSKLALKNHGRCKRHGHNNSLMPAARDSHMGLDGTSELAELSPSLFSTILTSVL